MKTITYKILLSFVILSSGWSCTSFLDEEVYTTVPYEDFYKSEEDIRSAVIASYSKFQNTNYYDNQIFLIADMSTDLVEARFKNNVYDSFSTQKDHAQYKTFWEGAWAANNAINCAIVYGGKVDMDLDLRNQILAEAYFLRALNYFNLIRVYGRVPLVLTPVTSVNDDLLPATASPEQVYAQIVEDLKFAKEHLQTNDEAGGNLVATKGAATALLAKVYLTMAGYHKNDDGTLIEKGDVANYALSYDELKSIINQEVGTYDLFLDYQDVFSNDTENGIENIFSIQYRQGATGGNDGGEGSQKQTSWAPQYGITHTAYETYRVSGDFYERVYLIDKRREVSFLDDFVDQSGVRRLYGSNMTYAYNRKYLRDMREGGEGGFINTSAKDGEENTIVLRYSDVLLMMSEAMFYKDNKVVSDAVLADLNKVRSRAGLANLTTATVTDEASFLKALLDERERELCFEGHLWFDYARLGELNNRVSKLATRGDYKFYTWPIPSLEIRKNPNLQQSQGWE